MNPLLAQAQLQAAVEAVVGQRMRFTTAAAKFGVPKATLYDNVLGKTGRMDALDAVSLSERQEAAVVAFCCGAAASAFNRRSHRSLREVVRFVEAEAGADLAHLGATAAFRWWWAFCKKHSIISLYFNRTPSTTSWRRSAPPPAHQASSARNAAMTSFLGSLLVAGTMAQPQNLTATRS